MKRNRPYTYLNHTADVKFTAFGNSLDDAFVNALLAMINIMTPVEKIRPRIEREISVSGFDKKALLYNFLEEAIFLFESEGFIPCKVSNIEMDWDKRLFLKATLLGDEARNYDVRGYIKAVTYSEMEIECDKNGWRLQVVLDV